jgi:ethanolamine utilization cobalamin adenosyltransferase
MKTDQPTEPPAAFLQTVSAAVVQLKQRLQQDYEQAYPDLREIIHLVLNEEEANAWDLTLFPHLLLPDLVEAHVAKLNLEPVETKQADVFAPRDFNDFTADQAVYAVCGC